MLPTKRKPLITRKEAITWHFPASLSPAHHSRLIRISSIILAMVAALWLPQARFDYNPINLRDQTSESITTYKDLIANHNISPSSIMVLTPDEQQVHALQQQLNHLDSVDNTVSLLNFIPNHQQDKLDVIDEMSLLLALMPTAVTPSPVNIAEQRDAIAQLTSTLNTYRNNNAVHLNNGSDHVAPSQRLNNNSHLEVRLQSRLNPLLGAAKAALPVRGSGLLFKRFTQLQQQLQSFSRMLANQSAATQQITLTALEHDLLGTLPASLDLLQTTLAATPVNRQNIPADLRQRWLSSTGLYRIEVMPKADIGNIKQLRRFVRQVRTIAPNATGGPVFTLEAGDAVIGAFVQAFAIALLLITLLLFLLLRSLSDTLLILLPLLLATLLTGAGAVWLGIPFNFANVIALPLLLGIGVDNGIHMVQRFRHMESISTQFTKSKHHPDLLHSSTSKAVVLSALTTICSFGALSFSPHQGTAGMGQLLTLGVIIILICTLIVLPAFLQWQPIKKHTQAGNER